jgi:hypothetical protein
MRLFRQPRPGLWEPVVEELAAALALPAAAPGTRSAVVALSRRRFEQWILAMATHKTAERVGSRKLDL